MSIYYTTINGETNGRASHFHKDRANAQSCCNDQNARVEQMGIKARYTVAEHSGVGIDSKDIRA